MELKRAEIVEWLIEDWTYQEIQDTLGISSTVLKMRLARARMRLRKLVV